MSYGEQTRNPYENDDTTDRDDDRVNCSCGDTRCWIDGNDDTNVKIGDRWFAESCVGLCILCRELDDANKLIRIAGFWLAHEACCTHDQAITDALARQARDDEDRDDMNLVRR